MITIEHQEISAENLREQNRTANTQHREQISFAVNELEGDVFEELLKDVLTQLLEAHKVYFVFSESKAQPKSRMRTFKKMFYEERKRNVIKARDLVNIESSIDESNSLLSSVLSVHPENLDAVIPELLTKNFRFAFVVKKGKRSFSSSRQDFLDHLINRVVKNRRFDRSEVRKLATRLTGKNKHAFQISAKGNGAEQLDVVVDQSNKQVIEGLNSVGQKYRSLAFN